MSKKSELNTAYKEILMMKRSDSLAWMRRVAIILFLIVAAMVSRCVYPYHGRAREIDPYFWSKR